MKIRLNPKEFLKRFKIAASVCPKVDVRPILANIKIVAAKHGTVLMATDTEVGIRITVKCEVLADGAAVLPIKQFRQILETEKNPITLTTVDEGLAVESQTMNTVLHTQSPDEYPDVTEFTATAYHTIEAANLQKAIQRTLFAVEPNHHKYTLNCVCFENQTETISVVATDGRRLAVQEVAATNTGNHSFTIDKRQTLVPIKCLQILDTLLKETAPKQANCRYNMAIGNVGRTVKMAVTTNTVTYQEPVNTVTFQYQDATLFACLLTGRFPLWQAIMPSNPTSQACVKGSDLLPAIKTVNAVVAASFEPGIYLTFEPGKLTLQGYGKEVGKTTATIPADFTSTLEQLTVKINPDYLTSLLATLDKNVTLTFEMTDADNPILITNGDAYRYVVMPMAITATHTDDSEQDS